MDENLYLSDLELENLINEIESQGVQEAPVDLKGIVFDKIERHEKNKKHRTRNQLWTFGAKIVLSAAAAIFFLSVIPMNQKTPEDMVKEQEQRFAKYQEYVSEEHVLDTLYKRGSSFWSELFQNEAKGPVNKK